MSDQQIYRGDCNTQTADPCGTEQEDNRLTLTGICSDTGSTCRTNRGTSNGERDNYIDFGGTDADRRTENGGGRDDCYKGGTRVTLKSGDTFWALAEKKYGNCNHPIEAIYAANGLYPKVTQKDGKIEMTDPTYFAGKSYIMPDEKDIDRLSKQYRAKVEEMGRSSQERVGTADQETKVKLIYGDTFSRMAQAKYGHSVPAEAIYEANGMTGQYAVKDGNCHCSKEPIYYAGKTYTMPAEKDIPELTRKYWERVGHPENCPPEYRKPCTDNDSNDRYGDDGETANDRGRNCPDKPVPPATDDRYGDTGETDRDRQGDQRRGCGCGGAGCESCRGGGRRRPETGCACGGAGCESCGGGRRRHEGGCQNCGGGGCESCRGGHRHGGRHHEHDGEDEAFEEGYRRGYRDAMHDNLGNCVDCGGGGCPSCVGTGVRQEGYEPERPPHRGGRNRDTSDNGSYTDYGDTGRYRQGNGSYTDYGDTGAYNGTYDGSVSDRRTQQGCTSCHGSGCESCQGRRRPNPDACECGGAGCDTCGGQRRRRQRQASSPAPQRSLAEDQRRYYREIARAQDAYDEQLDAAYEDRDRQ